MLAQTLIDFEKRVAEEFERGEIKGPIHLSGGNEEQLKAIFKNVSCGDWVFSTWRNHYHALLHKIPADKVLSEIRAGRSMNLTFPEHRFYASAIVGGILPIATGVAAALKRKGCGRKVWCFVGDMAARTGIVREATDYAYGHDLPLKIIVEDNGVSTNTATEECWGSPSGHDAAHLVVQERYHYTRVHPHVGTGKWVTF